MVIQVVNSNMYMKALEDSVKYYKLEGRHCLDDKNIGYRFSVKSKNTEKVIDLDLGQIRQLSESVRDGDILIKPVNFYFKTNYIVCNQCKLDELPIISSRYSAKYKEKCNKKENNYKYIVIGRLVTSKGSSRSIGYRLNSSNGIENVTVDELKGLADQGLVKDLNIQKYNNKLILRPKNFKLNELPEIIVKL